MRAKQTVIRVTNPTARAATLQKVDSGTAAVVFIRVGVARGPTLGLLREEDDLRVACA